MGQDEQVPERRYSLWKAWGLSFFSKALYRDVAENWKGTAYGALFLTIFLLSIPRGFYIQDKFADQVPDFFKRIPPFKIEKGVFSTEAAQPYRIDYKGGAIVIDTTGRYQSLTDVPGYGNLERIELVKATEYLEHRVVLGNVQDRTRRMLKLDSFIATREDLDRWGERFAFWLGPALFLFILLGWSLMNGVTLLLYALLGVFIADVRKGSLDFKVSLRLAVVSHFPAMILLTLTIFLSVDSHWSLLWTSLISIGYLVFAVSSLDFSEEVEEDAPKRKVSGRR